MLGKRKRQTTIHTGNGMESDNRTCDESVAKFIIANNIPPAVLESPEWKRMVTHLRNANSRWVATGRKKLTDKMLPAFKKRATKEMVAALKKNPKAGRTITGDGAKKAKTPLIDFLVFVPGAGVLLLDVIDCSLHLKQGGQKDGLYIAHEMKRVIKQV